MTTRAGILVAVGATVAGLVTAVPTAASTGSVASTAPAAAPPTPKWTACATKAYPRLQCATVRAPLDHDRPSGRRITLALSRIPHTAKTTQGPLLVNPGGPGGSGLSMAGFVAASLPAALAAQYDVIGFDPRGVGKSTPALDCVPKHFDPVRPDAVPDSYEAEKANRNRAAAFAAACGAKHGDLLPFMDTVSAAKDLDVIRRALGARQVNYFGYSYGTYLGAVYAKLFPERVRRLVLDSVVDPDGVWYEDNLAQDHAFDARHKAFAAWVAKNDTVYGLGTDPARVEAAWYRMRAAVKAAPAGGRVGPSELEDTFLPGGYYNGYWPHLAEAFAAYVNDHDENALITAYENFAAGDSAGDNGYSVYTAVQCRDAAWPRTWSTWRNDTWQAHRKAPFMAWNNTWYNAPCATWPVEPLTPVGVSNHRIPPALLLQATDDAATPYEGGATLHRKLRGSALVVEQGGGNHGISLSGNDCLDAYLVDYLTDGTVPRAAGSGADAVCDALPEPKPLTTAKAGTDAKGSALHGLLGFRG
ncbi:MULTISPECIES: alpha/beta hydrolase [Streptomyces]|uniref:Pimeloyl-ACP methyl ester carboxylesterase n=1 Tax=Streptomyces clavifer TaxID=68188 RepID=A0ABS4V257_9ACTN|nr:MULTISPECIES: alpha/beta hydrolase [Streptomyces]MBP2357997.1 pimeloyl-ACP methyl ester carboxylesterase [Streptomyces clavifer]MDX2742336.1 alpha/beta hydrolase [Streptomyces sp. NRRL_B-2557]GHA87707.1 peptidase [Streptomyces clavifer]